MLSGLSHFKVQSRAAHSRLLGLRLKHISFRQDIIIFCNKEERSIKTS
jgi:hypothetical protein